MIRIVLGKPEYRELVAGHEVQIQTLGSETVALILADIGWAEMLFAIEEAMRDPAHKIIKDDN